LGGARVFLARGCVRAKHLTSYPAKVAVLTVGLKASKRKPREGIGWHAYVTFTLILSLLLVRFNVFFGTGEGTDILITDFFSCDRLGDPQDYFPIKTTAYFNISVGNLAYAPKNVSIYISILDHSGVPIGLDQLNITIPPSASTRNIMSIFIPKWARVGFATAWASVFEKGSAVDSEITEFYIGPEDLAPPVIQLLSPENVTYGSESVPLVFTVDERTFWLGYSWNNLENVSIAENTTVSGLTNGLHSIIVYANDTSGNMGSSEEVYFEIFIVHDVAVFDVRCSSAEAYIGQIVNITVSVENKGTVTETFDVSAYANTTDIGTLTITDLFMGCQATLVFTWNTTSFTKGNYTISAIADAVLGETDTADNTYVDGIVNIMRRPDIAVINVASSQTSIGQGYSIPINATVRNKGDYTEAFNVTAYANTTVIQTKTVTLTSGNSTIITFLWDTTTFAKGNYTIVAVAWPVTDETDTTDNTLVDGWVFVTIPGDVDGDRDVDIFDIVRMADIYGISQPDSRYDPNCDIDGDGDIDIFDIIIASANYGKSW